MAGRLPFLLIVLAAVAVPPAAGGAFAPALPLTTMASVDPGTVLFQDDFESGAVGWTANGLWHLSSHRANGTAWYYGLESNHTYDTGEANAGSVTSPPIDLTGADAALLGFSTFADGEGGFYEHPIVDASTDGFLSFTRLIDERVLPYDGQMTADLSAFAGSVVVLRFVWDTLDEVANAHEGWVVDDVRVVAVAPRPDLVVSLSFDEPRGFAGSSVGFEVEVRNVGESAANESVLRVDIYDGGGQTVQDVNVSTLAPGASATIHFDHGACCTGYMSVGATADVEGVVAEKDESNSAYGTLEIKANGPDLAAYLHAFGGSADLGEPISIDASVANEGNEATPATNATLYDLSASDEGMVVVGQYDVPALAPGETFPIALEHAPTVPGRHTLALVSDAGNVVEETAANNDVAYDEVFVHGPNLRVVTLTLDPPMPFPGEEFDILAEVAETEYYDLEGADVAIRFVATKAFTGETVEFPGASFDIEGGEVVEVDSYGALPEGEWKVEATVDTSGLVAETDELDNVAALTFLLSTGPDMRASDVRVSPASPLSGQPIVFDGLVENAGPVDAPDVGFTWTLAGPDGSFVFDVGSYGPMVAGAGFRHGTGYFGLPAGTYTVGFQVHADGDPVPANDGNSTTFTVVDEAPADLVVTNVTVSPAAPQVGDIVVFNAYVQNAGGTAADFEIAWTSLQPDGEDVEFARGTATLAGGESDVLHTAAFVWRAGYHRVTATLDPAGSVAESHEGNNVAAMEFYATEGTSYDGAVFGLFSANETLEPGEAVVFGTQLANLGTETTNVSAWFSVDGQPVGTAERRLGAGSGEPVFASWLATPGTHVVEVRAVIAEPDSDPSNDVATLTVFVPDPADLSVRIVSVEKESLRTDVGDARFPLGRQVVTVEACDLGGVATSGEVTLTVESEIRKVGTGRAVPADGAHVDLRPGECRTLRLAWDPIGSAGDADLVVRATADDGRDADLANNEDRASTFVLVGGLGGVVLA